MDHVTQLVVSQVKCSVIEIVNVRKALPKTIQIVDVTPQTVKHVLESAHVLANGQTGDRVMVPVDPATVNELGQTPAQQTLMVTQRHSNLRQNHVAKFKHAKFRNGANLAHAKLSAINMVNNIEIANVPVQKMLIARMKNVDAVLPKNVSLAKALLANALMIGPNGLNVMVHVAVEADNDHALIHAIQKLNQKLKWKNAKKYVSDFDRCNMY